MGPRLGSRGKQANIAKQAQVQQLQWGRDLEVAERQLPWIDACRVNRASMGPRLGSRGK